jgi:hypothetical protein
MQDHVTKTKYSIDWTKVTSALKKLGSYTIILLALSSGFFLGRVSNDILPKTEAPKPSVKQASEISIAINEANQMLIIDKKTGKYDMFADSVGITIFRMYAGKMYQQQAGK